MSMVGADADELEAAAAELANEGRHFTSAVGKLNGAIHSSPWNGPGADQFRRSWDTEHRLALSTAAAFLEDAGHVLRRNASEQRKASMGDGAGGPKTFFDVIQKVVKDLGKVVHELAEKLRWANHEVEKASKMTPEEQAKWWAGLTPAEQALLIAMAPVALLALPGLPADARTAANKAAVEAAKSDIAVGEASIKAELEVDVKVIKVGAEAEIIEKTYADGHVEVTIRGGASIGMEWGDEKAASAGVSLHGEVSRTYSFDSAADAHKFQLGLIDSLTPEVSASTAAKLAMFGGSPAALVADSVKHYLDGYGNKVTSTTVGGSLEGDATLKFPGVGEVKVHGGVGVEHDFTSGSTTAHIEVSGKGSLSLGPDAGTAGASGKVALTWDEHGNVTSMSYTGSYKTLAGQGSESSSALVGTGGSFNMKVDLSSASNRALAMEFTRATAANDPVAAASAFNQLRDASQITVQANVLSETQNKFDIGIAEGSISTSSKIATSTYVKPPHGTMTKI